MLRDFKDDFFSKFNVEKEYKDFEKIIEEQKREEKRDYENENGQKPDAKLPATVAAAIFLSEVSIFLKLYVKKDSYCLHLCHKSTTCMIKILIIF